jgi:hypothetical protein
VALNVLLPTDNRQRLVILKLASLKVCSLSFKISNFLQIASGASGVIGPLAISLVELVPLGGSERKRRNPNTEEKTVPDLRRKSYPVTPSRAPKIVISLNGPSMDLAQWSAVPVPKHVPARRSTKSTVVLLVRSLRSSLKFATVTLRPVP